MARYDGVQGHEDHDGLVLVHEACFCLAGDDGVEDALLRRLSPGHDLPMSTGADRPVRAWVLPVYGSLLGTLAGLGVGYFAWQVFARHSDAVCFALTAGGTRCTGGTSPVGWTYRGGAVGAGLGLTLGVIAWLRSRRI